MIVYSALFLWNRTSVDKQKSENRTIRNQHFKLNKKDRINSF